VPSRPFTKLIFVLQTAVHPKGSVMQTNMNLDPTFSYSPRFRMLLGKLNVWYLGLNPDSPDWLTSAEFQELERESALQVQKREQGNQEQHAAAHQSSAASATASRAVSKKRDTALSVAQAAQQAAAAASSAIAAAAAVRAHSPSSFSSSTSSSSSSSASYSSSSSAAAAARAATMAAADSAAAVVAQSIAANATPAVRTDLDQLRALLDAFD
jgi:hypothetical protein